MPNIYVKIKTWQLMWLKRAFLGPNRRWVCILDSFLEDISFTHLIHTNYKPNPYIKKTSVILSHNFKGLD